MFISTIYLLNALLLSSSLIISHGYQLHPHKPHGSVPSTLPLTHDQELENDILQALSYKDDANLQYWHVKVLYHQSESGNRSQALKVSMMFYPITLHLPDTILQNTCKVLAAHAAITITQSSSQQKFLSYTDPLHLAISRTHLPQQQSQA
jgi:hypothetical protein